jgi:hypothetical protein
MIVYKIRSKGNRFMRLENEFLLLYSYSYSKIVTAGGVFKVHFSHKMLFHCTPSYQVIFLYSLNTSIRKDVEW